MPPFKPSQLPLVLKSEDPVVAGRPVTKFVINSPVEITSPRTIKVLTTQIQYSQIVELNFNTLTWPHVSVATLVPADNVVIPPSAWA